MNKLVIVLWGDYIIQDIYSNNGRPGSGSQLILHIRSIGVSTQSYSSQKQFTATEVEHKYPTVDLESDLKRPQPVLIQPVHVLYMQYVIQPVQPVHTVLVIQ